MVGGSTGREVGVGESLTNHLSRFILWNAFLVNITRDA